MFQIKSGVLSISLLAGLSLSGYSQVDKDILNWYNKDNPGMSIDKAYGMVKGKASVPVVVGVIDSGVDIEHEDLKGRIWTNVKEIPGNGIDDDKNGYVDDVHGWNFLGNPNGKNSNHENLEITRIVRRYKSKYDGAGDFQSEEEKKMYKMYQDAKAKLEQEMAENKMELAQIQMLIDKILPMVPQIVSKELGKTDYTLKDLMKWKPKSNDMNQFKQLAIAMKTGDLTAEALQEGIKHYKDVVDYHLNVDFNGREVVGDDPDNFSQKNYGNGDVEGPDALHGTHVAGIIAAIRGNNLGGDGVAENVQIMSVRAVPDGDEYDKDVAFGIRYAVDNGASVINMSFGKSFSPHQRQVYDAMKYAESKGVLLVHAAGNDAKNVDTEPNFPAVKFDFQKEDFTNLITVGAATRYKKGQIVASFSNYGKNSVDIFAPGFEIYNTIPDNKYKKLQGTSMAAPMVAGAAAFLKSNFPSLTMFQIKDIIIESGVSYAGTLHNKPGSQEKIDFAELSKHGKILNLANAVKLAKEKVAVAQN